MPLMDFLAKLRAKRGLISTLYGRLTEQPRETNSCLARKGWEKDLGKMTDETWQGILESPQQCLTQV